MTQWSIRVNWTHHQPADPESPSLAEIATRLRGQTPTTHVDPLTGETVMTITLRIEASDEKIARRRAHYLLAEATKFTAARIHTQARYLDG